MMEERPFSDVSYEQFLAEDKLMGSRCKKCGALFLPPEAVCTKCLSFDMEWVQMKGKGKLLAYTCVVVGPDFMKEEGFDREHPYCCGLVELDEGARILARIEGVDAGNPESIEMGTAVTLKCLHRDGAIKTFLAFEPL